LHALDSLLGRLVIACGRSSSLALRSFPLRSRLGMRLAWALRLTPAARRPRSRPAIEVWNVHAGFASDHAGSFSERHAVAELDKMDDITVVPWIPLVAEKAFDPVPRSRCVFFATVRIDDGDLRCTAVAHDLHAPLDDFEGSWVGKLLEAMSIDLSSART